jgi:hypothetical protein
VLELQEKKLKTSTTGTQGIKTLTKNQSSCVNFNAEWNRKTATLHQKSIPPLRIQTPAKRKTY